MPVAKLSREFYEKFGDKLTDELVNCLNSIEGSYRAELRDLFAAHFARFEERLERRLMDSKTELGAAKAELGIKIEQLRVELHSTKVDMLKWSVGLWVPVTLVVIGLDFQRLSVSRLGECGVPVYRSLFSPSKASEHVILSAAGAKDLLFV